MLACSSKTPLLHYMWDPLHRFDLSLRACNTHGMSLGLSGMAHCSCLNPRQLPAQHGCHRTPCCCQQRVVGTGGSSCCPSSLQCSKSYAWSLATKSYQTCTTGHRTCETLLLPRPPHRFHGTNRSECKVTAQRVTTTAASACCRKASVACGSNRSTMRQHTQHGH
jgi:hypothetical protein